MGIYAELVGNVLASPTMKQVNTASGARRIVELRVMSASYRRLDDGTLEQREGRTFPVDVTVWNERLTERVMQHIRTGASVVVRGDFYVSPWLNRDNEADAGAHIDVESISLNLVRVEQVVYRQRQPREDEGASDPAHDEGAGEPADPGEGDTSPADPTPDDAPASDDPGPDATSSQSGRRRSRQAARTQAQ
ncbi:single-stranded DNA-binding protein [Paraburkholderia phenoliruptrix]|uniref:Single-strand DNA-binding protein n=2 Tax=Paraburkholderia phenoliruptrix TaxID=252970 RepID=K0E1M9_9BURK|nr:single-stranded DNA-binding protein [Paraburkholderia phenoliruptrix]AFT90338.1 single-strand DNA-binding protein [Paraburkholderia phenoliruptrix BR3459a]CAB4051755.1 Single-stranded DNA-binding protein [Paraburkholderia phenoliruptrix]